MLPARLAPPPTVSDCESWSFLREGFPPTMCMSRVNGWINTDLAPNEKIGVTYGAKRRNVKLGQTVGGLRPTAIESRSARAKTPAPKQNASKKQFYDASPVIPILY